MNIHTYHMKHIQQCLFSSASQWNRTRTKQSSIAGSRYPLRKNEAWGNIKHAKLIPYSFICGLGFIWKIDPSCLFSQRIRKRHWGDLQWRANCAFLLKLPFPPKTYTTSISWKGSIPKNPAFFQSKKKSKQSNENCNRIKIRIFLLKPNILGTNDLP